MECWQDCVAVVTGASTGIGAAIAKDLVKSGLVVVGLARRLQRMENLKSDLPDDQKERLFAYECDISNEKCVNAAFEWIINKFGGVDILVNNAGIGRPGKLCTMELSKIRQVIDVNMMGVIHCTQHAFRSMKERRFDGHIIIINSILGHSIPVMPSQVEMNVYPPTKYALTAITEIYRQEFKGLGTKVKITSISPGLVDTEIVSDDVKEVFNNAILKSEDISSGVLYALSTPPHVQVHELTIKPVGENM